jgi:hypothetical protein
MERKVDARDLLEISPFQSDEGQLIGKHPSDVPLGNYGPEFQVAKTSQGHSGEVSRLLLRQRSRSSQVRGS